VDRFEGKRFYLRLRHGGGVTYPAFSRAASMFRLSEFQEVSGGMLFFGRPY
jgi:hypothetical protein